MGLYQCACGNEFKRFSTLQNKCVDCMVAEGRKIMTPGTKEYDQRTRQMKKELNESDIKWWRKNAQDSCNAYIRYRDRGMKCPTCDKVHLDPRFTIDGIDQREWHAGHFRTRKAQPALRYCEHNIVLQCGQCNKFDNPIDIFRRTLVERWGVDMVEWLEKDFAVYKFTIDELREISLYYRARLKALKRGMNS